MRIDSIEIFRGSLPEPGAGNAPLPALHSKQEVVSVRLAAGGLCGWGEIACRAAPTDRPEWSASILVCLTDWLAPAIYGQDIPSGQALQAALAAFMGNPLAKSVLDLAWWDLEARGQGRPLWQVLEGQQPWVEVGASIRPQSTADDLLRAVGAAFELGHGLVTLEVRPGWDLPMLRGVRDEFPTQRIALDFRGAATLEQRDLFFRLEDFQPAWFEQPLAADDWVGHAMLQEGLRTPICLSQGVDSPQRARQAADLGSCRLARIDPTTSGGLTPALAIQQECRAAGIGCLATVDASGTSATCASLALGTLPGAVQPAVTLSGDGIARWGPSVDLVNFELVKSFGRVPSDLPAPWPVMSPARLVPTRCQQAEGRLCMELPFTPGLDVFSQ